MEKSFDALVDVGHNGTEKGSMFETFLTLGTMKVNRSIDVGDLCHKIIAYAELARFIIECPWLEITDKRGIAAVLFDRLKEMTAERPNIQEPMVQAPPF